MDLVLSYSLCGFPLKRTDVADAVQMMVKTLPAERHNAIPFIEGRPGRKFLSLFAIRHRDKIHFGRASKEEEVRWKATSAANLTSHFAEI